MTARAAGFNTKSPTIKRILQESRELNNHPDPSLTASPLESNLFEWHFTIAGPPDTPYASGIYHGRIILPPTYPLRPPMFRFLTPSGRFEVNREICLSISGHHEETWQPAWGIRTALCAIRAFMETGAKGQVGGLDVSESARKRIALESRSWKCGNCGNKTNGEVMKECEEAWKEAQEGEDESRASIARNQVPEELRLGYKDEMGAQEETSEATATPSKAEPDPRMRGTGAVTSQQQSPPPAVESALPAQSSAVQASDVRLPYGSRPAPTPTHNAPPAQAVRTYGIPTGQLAMQPPPSLRGLDEGVPPWVDKAIFGVVASLIFMVLKKLFS